jgi:DNA-binding HxlR family transcriptional regulator
VEIMGERWALLIVRDLLVGPRRYSDLRRGLPRIPTNILAARLKELERAGVVQRRLMPQPNRSITYELTEYGQELDGAVTLLSRWGARSLGAPKAGEIVTVDSLTMAMRTTFDPVAAAGLIASFELRTGGIVVNLRIAKGRLAVGEGPLPRADLVIETGGYLKALMAGEISPAEATASGEVRLIGDPDLLTRFVEIFPIGPPPTSPP